MEVFEDLMEWVDKQVEIIFPTPPTSAELLAQAQADIKRQQNALINEQLSARVQGEKVRKECGKWARERKLPELEKATRRRIAVEKREARTQSAMDKLMETKIQMNEMLTAQVGTQAMLATMNATNAQMIDPALAKRTAMRYTYLTGVRETVNEMVKETLDGARTGEVESDEIENEADAARLKELIAQEQLLANQELLPLMPAVGNATISSLVFQESAKEMAAKNAEIKRELSLFLSSEPLRGST
jgi:hypothetical protein